MTRKDNEKDSERPHYYSQFWLDVAAGRRIIGAPKPNEEGEIEEKQEPTPPHPSRGRGNDGYAENIVHPVAEPIESETHEYRDSASKNFEQDTDDDDLDSNETYQVEDEEIPDIMDDDAGDVDESEDGESEYYDDEEEEGEDDVDWGRGRKKSKPARPVKPTVKKSGKRDTRRNF